MVFVVTPYVDNHLVAGAKLIIIGGSQIFVRLECQVAALENILSEHYLFICVRVTPSLPVEFKILLVYYYLFKISSEILIASCAIVHT